METTTHSVTDNWRKYRPAALTVLIVALAGAGLVAVLIPQWRGVAGYFLYAIPAHLLISVLANEPALFAAAKVAPPVVVAIAGTLGCLVAIVLDYALVGWFVNRRLIKTEIDDSRGFRAALRFFDRAPFLLIVVSAAVPGLPFYPAKILGIIRDYPLSRFVAAIVIGRFPRFYLLALLGQRVNAPNSALGSAAGALALIGIWGLWRTILRNRRARQGR